MYERTRYQFEGFINTSSIFRDSKFMGLNLFKFPENLTYLPSKGILEKGVFKNLVLGKRVENFFLEAINTSKNYQIVANNIQISDNHRTLGELDFILKEIESSRLLHIELMYKFYIYDPEITTEMERWIGPNRKDSLLQKIEKVKENQFPLLYKSETKEYLQSINIDSGDIQQEICFKASLFIPKELKSYNFPHINEECILGFWIRLKDFRAYNQEGFQFFSPEKQDWPIEPKFGEEWNNYTTIYNQIQDLHLRNKSPLIWIKNPHGNFERIIVVWW